VAETLEEVIEPIVFDEALDLIAAHRAAGRRVYIISASPEEIVVPLARYLEVDEAIATRAAIDADGRYTGEVDFYAYGPFKAERMQEVADERGIDLDASYAYSDSVTDIPMLDAVGHAVAVNPDRDLARVALERGWEVRWFTHKVPLRERVGMPAPGPTAAVGGGIAATAAAGVAAYWWLRRERTVRATAEQLSGLARVLPELSRLAGAAAGHTSRAQSATATALALARRRPPVRR
jgi:phosphoserine phosphatase